MYNKRKTELLKNSMPIIASALGDKLGVRITISGTGAYTTGTEINIPDFQISSKEEKDAVLGYLAHEAAHVRFNSLEGIPLNLSSIPFRQSLWNIFEDIRIENAMAITFIGTIQWMNATAKQVFLKDLKVTSEHDEPASILQNLLLFHGRSKCREPEQDFLDFKFQAANKSAIKVFGSKLTNDVLSLVNTELSKLNSSVDALNLAIKVETLLKEQVNNQDDDNSESNDSESSDSESSDSESSDSESSDSESSDSESSDSEIEAIKSALESDIIYDDMEEFTQTMQILSRANSAHSLNVEMPILAGINVNSYFNTLANELTQSVKASSNQLTAKLQGIVEEELRCRCKTKKSGSRLNSKVLHRLSVGDARIFKGKDNKRSIDTRVEIILDNSGSMYTIMPIAKQATLSLALALSKINGVKQGATAFPVDFDECRASERTNIHNLLDENEPVNNLANRLTQLKGNGFSTPSASAMLYALKKLYNSQAKKRVVFFITDGLCDEESTNAFKNYISLAEKNNITIIGIGVGELASSHTDKAYFTHQFKKSMFITDITRLKTELFKLAKEILL